MTPLQTLIQNRLAELDMSYREAAAKTGGLISFSYLQQIATGAKDAKNLGDKKLLGLSLAIAVPQGQVEEAVKASQGVTTEFRMPAKHCPGMSAVA